VNNVVILITISIDI